MTIVGTASDGWLILDRLHIKHGSDTVMPTVSQAFEMWWLPDAEERLEAQELSKHTYANKMSRWRRHVQPRWGDVFVGDVRVLEIQEWLKSLTSTTASSSLALLRQILEFCVKYELMDRNPASAGFRMPKRAERSHSKDVYALDEMVAALDAVRGTAAYIPAVMSGIGSCRFGEALSARVDLGEVRREEVGGMVVAVVDLVRQVDANGHPTPDHSMKTSASERPVIIPEPWSLDVLAERGPWLCDNGLGAPVSQKVVSRCWKRALDDAGIKMVPFRNLRNSWRTYMRWELGVPEDMLEAMMGHVGRNVGEVHYDRPRWEHFATEAVKAWKRRHHERES